jgi:hypothetical protein
MLSICCHLCVDCSHPVYTTTYLPVDTIHNMSYTFPSIFPHVKTGFHYLVSIARGRCTEVEQIRQMVAAANLWSKGDGRNTCIYEIYYHPHLGDYIHVMPISSTWISIPAVFDTIKWSSGTIHAYVRCDNNTVKQCTPPKQFGQSTPRTHVNSRMCPILEQFLQATPLSPAEKELFDMLNAALNAAAST